MAERRIMTLAVQRYDRTQALINRTVAIPDMYVLGTPPRTSVEGVVNGNFDIGEMPVARYLFLREQGEPFTAIPVFPDRLFVQQYIYTRPDTSIKALADLKGKKVMVSGYFITASFWHRAMLQEQGVQPQDIDWYTFYPERDARMKPPSGVKTTFMPAEQLGVNRLLDGSVDALMLEATPPVTRDQASQMVQVHPDVAKVQREWYRKHKFHIAVHVIAIRQSAVDERPELIDELCKGFDESKALAYNVLQNERLTSMPLMRTYIDETREIFGDDPWPYGYDANKAEMDQLLEYVSDQGFLKRRMKPEDLFDEAARQYKFMATMPFGSEPFIHPMP
jgi:4,5-dihydroxyphthalate decarboxylase